MPRPKRYRRLFHPPIMRGFKPFGIPMKDLEQIILELDEFESLRLTDYKNLTHEDAAREMNVSRPTFTRIYEKARKKIASAFMEGKVILIKGGSIEFKDNWYRCNSCHGIFRKTGTARVERCVYCRSNRIVAIEALIPPGQMEKEETYCICPSCKTRVRHRKGLPCREHKCPDCRSAMVKE